MVSRGISNLLALLIVVTIVIAVALVTNNFVFSFLMTQRPSGSDLVLTGFVWWWEFVEDEGKYVIHVKGSVVNVGSDPVNITGVYAVISNEKYQLRFRRIENLKPNDVNELIASGNAPVPDTSVLTIVVEWCNVKECSKSVANAQLSSLAYVINKNVLGATTVTVPGTTVTTTITHTITRTATITVPATTTTITATQTATTTITMTTTATATVTTTTTTTATITRPTWVVNWLACYDISDNIYVAGYLQKPVNEKEPIPYVVKFYDCTIFGCNLLAVRSLSWIDKKSFSAEYYLPDPKPFHTYKIEIWSVDWATGKYIDKVYEQVIDTSVRCA